MDGIGIGNSSSYIQIPIILLTYPTHISHKYYLYDNAERLYTIILTLSLSIVQYYRNLAVLLW